jgi:Spy/CpxP family protein refolding chaperone
MKKMVMVLGLAAAVVLGITYVYAQSTGYGRTGWGYGEWSSLTPEQETKLQELRQKFNDETAQLRDAITTRRLELKSLWSHPKADPKAIQEKEKELRTLQDQMREKAVQFKLEARNILTPEQLAQNGPGWGRGGFGRAYRMGPGYGMGRGYGMGPGYEMCY